MRYITDEQLKSQWNGVCKNVSFCRLFLCFNDWKILWSLQRGERWREEEEILDLCQPVSSTPCQLRRALRHKSVGKKSLTNWVNWCQMHFRIVWNFSHPRLRFKLLLLLFFFLLIKFLRLSNFALGEGKSRKMSRRERGELQFLLPSSRLCAPSNYSWWLSAYQIIPHPKSGNGASKEF